MEQFFRLRQSLSHTLRDYERPSSAANSPHNPLSRIRHFAEERRSKLFTDRPYIFGRVPKFWLSFVFSFFFWSGWYVYQKHQHAAFSGAQTKKITTRILPFIQAMEDVRYIALQERNYMILKAICDSENPQLFELYRNRYHQEDIFLSFVRGALNKTMYDGRYGTERFFYIKTWRRPEEENGLVNLQQVSHYG